MEGFAPPPFDPAVAYVATVLVVWLAAIKLGWFR